MQASWHRAAFLIRNMRKSEAETEKFDRQASLPCSVRTAAMHETLSYLTRNEFCTEAAFWMRIKGCRDANNQSNRDKGSMSLFRLNICLERGIAAGQLH